MRFLLSALLLLSCAFSVRAERTHDYLEQLKQQAKEQRLHQQAQWQRLMHYRDRRFLGGVESTVDFPGFFLAADGKTNPESELAATLTAFFSDQKYYKEPAQCRFKARYEWLKRELAFDEHRLPQQACDRFRQWADALNVERVSLVFASNDMGGPSTMFGHTLLRLDAKGQGNDERLLAYAVNYAADTQQAAGMTYAVRGLTGSFFGSYSVYPYYEKVKEYARFEHRDLWEYRLNLTPEETLRLLAHLWELRGVQFDYYFFTENCSYQLLSLIEVARPDVSLTQRFDQNIPYAIPIDTIRELQRNDLISGVAYFPSQAHKLRQRLSSLTAPQRRWVLAYAKQSANLTDPVVSDAAASERAQMLELAYDYLYFQFQSGRVGREAGMPRARKLLLARSQIESPADFAEWARPRTAPDAGHGSGRVSLGYRVDDADGAAIFRVRPAYHDRLDPPGGYLPGAEIEFFDVGLMLAGGEVEVDSFRLISIQALALRDQAFRPWSWQVSTGARRYPFAATQTKDRLGVFVDGGGGMAWAPFPGTQLYLFGFGELDVNRRIRDGYALGLGTRFGLASQITERWTQALQLDVLSDAGGAADARVRVQAGFQYQVMPAHGLRLGFTHDRLESGERNIAMVSWLIYW
ncbi:MAG: DUF4105 domain-containing protein [Panacagrimonas sp.]